MKVNWNYILGTLTISAVAGFTFYAIREYKRTLDIQEESITVEQAKREIEDHENKQIEERFDSGDLEGFREPMLETSPEEFEHPQEITEEDKILRHDPNSDEAREQFIRMELADWIPGDDIYESLSYLFTFPFTPAYEEDDIVRRNLIDRRRSFFGEDSKWNNRITYAEVILYYGRDLVYNLDDSLDYWVTMLLDNTGIDYLTSSAEVSEILEDLNNHTFNNGGFHGLFSLTSDEMDAAYTVALQNDNDMNYNVQYNEFLKLASES